MSVHWHTYRTLIHPMEIDYRDVASAGRDDCFGTSLDTPCCHLESLDRVMQMSMPSVDQATVSSALRLLSVVAEKHHRACCTAV